jgi:hypothetical protein
VKRDKEGGETKTMCEREDVKRDKEGGETKTRGR